MEQIEQWRDIIGYEGLYQVSNLGRVKSLNYRNTSKSKVLKQCNEKGYLHLPLCKNGVVKTYSIHRLVAIAFIPNPNNYNIVNHKNEDGTDNRVENLEWCDVKYNSNYGTRNLRISIANSKVVQQYDFGGNFIAEYSSTMEVQRQFSFDHRNISKCCNNKQKTAYGYIWRYK